MQLSLFGALQEMDFAGKNKMSKRERSSVKVVYISTPMKVKTSASRFRALVQELTGRDSDISRFMDGYDGSTTANAATHFEIVPDQNFRVSKNSVNNGNSQHHHDLSSSSFPSVDSRRESPTSSGSLLDQQSFGTDHVFVNGPDYQFEEQYLKGVFSSNLFSDCSNIHELDVLGSYDAL